MTDVARLHEFAHAVVKDQPAVPGQDGRSAATDLEEFPRRNRSGQPVMRGKVAQVIGLTALDGHVTVGNPDAFPMEIRDAQSRVACLFLRTSSGKERPVQDRQCRLSRWIRNGDREDAGILVVHAIELDAVIRLESCQPQSLPVEQILRNGQGDSWASSRKRRVSHHVVSKRFDKGDTWILAAAAPVRSPLVIRFRLERNAQPLDTGRVAGVVECYAGDADARIVALCDEAREQVKLAIRAANSSGIQDTFNLLRIARFRLHHQPQALQLKAIHRLSH